MHVLLGSGIRISELLNLKIKDVNSEDSVIYVLSKGSKGEKQQRHLNNEALQMLVLYLRLTYDSYQRDVTYNERYIFSNDKGLNPQTPRSVQKYFSSIRKKMNSMSDEIKKSLTPHSLRHTFVHMLMEEGESIAVVSKLLGHKSMTATDKYLHAFDHELQKAVNNISIRNER